MTSFDKMEGATLHHSVLRISLLLLIAAVVPAVTSLPAGVCNTADCRACTNSCPTSNDQNHEKVDCTNKLAIARSKYLSSASLDCKVDPCAARYLANACYLLPETMKATEKGFSTKMQLLSKVAEDANKEAMNLNQRAAELARTQDPNRQSYYSRVTNMLITIQLLFSNALRTRAHFHRQKEYMASVHYRNVRQHVSRLIFENGDLRARVNYWQKQNDTLSFAVRTSPLALRNARNSILSEYQEYAADARLIDILKKVSLTKEEQATFIIRLKERVREQLNDLKTFNAHVKSEHVFMKQLGGEIFKMFSTLFRQMKERKVKVPCGSLALSSLVTDAIMSSTVDE